VIVGLVHPGEMGSALGDALRDNGHDVIWASEGRSDATRARAARLHDVESLAALAGEAQLVLSVCPPHAALDVARAVGDFDGVYVDANAISPARAREVAAVHRRYVDGGIVGPPPRSSGETRLYLSGDGAAEVASLFDGSVVDVRLVLNASALKMAYAAWSKGAGALLLAIRDVARHYGVGEALDDEWDESLHERLARAERSASIKGWRWVGEMEEIADTFAAAGQPDGFHRAAAAVFRVAAAPGRADA
jgi:3-hydroxyisobutyrate dehydrogenase-like beta-hydroxyacid dehydrogenase